MIWCFETTSTDWVIQKMIALGVAPIEIIHNNKLEKLVEH